MSGPAIVLLHSLGGEGAFWDTTRAALDAQAAVYAPDLRGHGAAGWDGPAIPEHYALDRQVETVRDVVTQHALERVLLVGHSFGATVALAVAAEAPAWLEGVLLIEAGGDFHDAPPGVIEQFLHGIRSPGYAEVVRDAFEANMERAKPATRDRVLRQLDDTPQAALEAGYTALFAFRPSAALGRWPGPVRLLADSGNASTFALHAQHPELACVAVDATSHWLPLDRPEVVARAIDDFLAGLAATERR